MDCPPYHSPELKPPSAKTNFIGRRFGRTLHSGTNSTFWNTTASQHQAKQGAGASGVWRVRGSARALRDGNSGRLGRLDYLRILRGFSGSYEVDEVENNHIPKLQNVGRAVVSIVLLGMPQHCCLSFATPLKRG
jgi:hypothetical protein